MQQRSAGILVFRRKGSAIEILLIHPGGPFWRKKDLGAWSIPKGLVEAGEENPQAAAREFREETGFECPRGEMMDLGAVRMKSGKMVHAWAVEGEIDTTSITSNFFSIEWPHKSGTQQEFPEIDKGAYFSTAEAREKLHEYQRPFVDRLLEKLGITE